MMVRADSSPPPMTLPSVTTTKTPFSKSARRWHHPHHLTHARTGNIFATTTTTATSADFPFDFRPTQTSNLTSSRKRSMYNRHRRRSAAANFTSANRRALQPSSPMRKPRTPGRPPRKRIPTHVLELAGKLRVEGRDVSSDGEGGEDEVDVATSSDGASRITRERQTALVNQLNDSLITEGRHYRQEAQRYRDRCAHLHYMLSERDRTIENFHQNVRKHHTDEKIMSEHIACLESQLAAQDTRCNSLKEHNKRQHAENTRLNGMVRSKDAIIRELKAKLEEEMLTLRRAREENDLRRKLRIAVREKGDLVDELERMRGEMKEREFWAKMRKNGSGSGNRGDILDPDKSVQGEERLYRGGLRRTRSATLMTGSSQSSTRQGAREVGLPVGSSITLICGETLAHALEADALHARPANPGASEEISDPQTLKTQLQSLRQVHSTLTDENQELKRMLEDARLKIEQLREGTENDSVSGVHLTRTQPSLAQEFLKSPQSCVPQMMATCASNGSGEGADRSQHSSWESITRILTPQDAMRVPSAHGQNGDGADDVITRSSMEDEALGSGALDDGFIKAAAADVRAAEEVMMGTSFAREQGMPSDEASGKDMASLSNVLVPIGCKDSGYATPSLSRRPDSSRASASLPQALSCDNASVSSGGMPSRPATAETHLKCTVPALDIWNSKPTEVALTPTRRTMKYVARVLSGPFKHPTRDSDDNVTDGSIPRHPSPAEVEVDSLQVVTAARDPKFLLSSSSTPPSPVTDLADKPQNTERNHSQEKSRSTGRRLLQAWHSSCQDESGREEYPLATSPEPRTSRQRAQTVGASLCFDRLPTPPRECLASQRPHVQPTSTRGGSPIEQDPTSHPKASSDARPTASRSALAVAEHPRTSPAVSLRRPSQPTMFPAINSSSTYHTLKGLPPPSRSLTAPWRDKRTSFSGPPSWPAPPSAPTPSSQAPRNGALAGKDTSLTATPAPAARRDSSATMLARFPAASMPPAHTKRLSNLSMANVTELFSRPEMGGTRMAAGASGSSETAEEDSLPDRRGPGLPVCRQMRSVSAKPEWGGHRISGELDSGDAGLGKVPRQRPLSWQAARTSGDGSRPTLPPQENWKRQRERSGSLAARLRRAAAARGPSPGGAAIHTRTSSVGEVHFSAQPTSPSASVAGTPIPDLSFLSSNPQAKLRITTPPIQNLTQTMIGTWLYKFNRHGKKPHMRFFWIHPYSFTLCWSKREPGGKKSYTKSVHIRGCSEVLLDRLTGRTIEQGNETREHGDRGTLKHWRQTSNASGASVGVQEERVVSSSDIEKLIVIYTPDRMLQVMALNGNEHQTWLKGIEYLMTRLNSGETLSQSTRPVTSGTVLTAGECGKDGAVVE